MSTETLEEKTSRPSTSSGRARATLAQLRARMGFVVLATDNAAHPTWVAVDFMERTTWKRVSGKGAEAVFEMEGD